MPCTIWYSLTEVRTCQYLPVRRVRTYLGIAHGSTYCLVPICGFSYGLVSTSIGTGSYQYIPSCTTFNQVVPLAPVLKAWFFFGSANALCAKTGGSNINMRLSKLDCMEISSIKGLSCITSENQHVSMLLWCRAEKIWGKKKFNPKSTGMWKSKPSEDKW